MPQRCFRLAVGILVGASPLSPLFYFLVTSTVTIFESDNCIPLELSNDSNVFEIQTVKRRFPAPGILGSGNETGSCTV